MILTHLFVINEHGRREGVCHPVNQFGGLLRGHVHQYTFRQKKSGQPGWTEAGILLLSISFSSYQWLGSVSLQHPSYD